MNKKTNLTLLEISNLYALHPLHPACSLIHQLMEENISLRNELKRPFVKEDGPWKIDQDDPCVIYSDDFSHDVSIHISGDFSDIDAKKEYINEIARRLNNYK